MELDELIELLLHSHLPAETPVWRTGLAEWVKAATIPEIASQLPPPLPLAEPSALRSTPAPSSPETAPEAQTNGGADPSGEDVVEEPGPPYGPPPLPGRHRRRRHRHRVRGSEPRWDLLAILAVALIVLVMVLWRMFRQGDAIPSGIVG